MKHLTFGIAIIIFGCFNQESILVNNIVNGRDSIIIDPKIVFEFSNSRYWASHRILSSRDIQNINFYDDTVITTFTLSNSELNLYRNSDTSNLYYDSTIGILAVPKYIPAGWETYIEESGSEYYFTETDSLNWIAKKSHYLNYWDTTITKYFVKYPTQFRESKYPFDNIYFPGKGFSLPIGFYAYKTGKIKIYYW